MLHNFANIIVLGSAVYHLVMGAACVLGVPFIAKAAHALYGLDFTGDWDPTLAFVMAGAVAVSALGGLFARRRDAPVLAPRFEVPSRHDIEARLVGGAALFGVGWGLAGYCPGPALVSLGRGTLAPFVFVATMIVGMLLVRVAQR
jgi:hypothetical protein